MPINGYFWGTGYVQETRIERIPIRDLYEFARRAQNDHHRYHVIPITTIRALAHTKNPAAAEDDIGLVVAYVNGQCAGYLGILPCRLSVGNKHTKVYALSTFYVDTPFRGTDVAKMIMSDAIELGYDLLLSGFTPAAEKFYRKNPQWFRPVAAVPYVLLRLDRVFVVSGIFRRLAQIRWLKPAHSLLGVLYWGSRWTIDAVLRPVLFHWLRPAACKVGQEIEARLVSAIRESEIKIDRPSKPCFCRDPDIINWMINHPWISEDSNLKLNYAFSYRRDRFGFRLFELHKRKGGERIGCVVFSVSTQNNYTTVKTLDYRIADRAYLPCVFAVALREALRHNAQLIGPDMFWQYVQAHWVLRRITRRLKRGNFLGPSIKSESVFDTLPEELSLDYCDGDIAFT